MTEKKEGRTGLPSVAEYALPTQEELPASRPGWEVSGNRAALLIHDMQRYFLRIYPEEVEPVSRLYANIREIRDRCDERGIPVFYTAQPGNQDPGLRGLQAHYWGPGMTDDPSDTAIVDQLRPGEKHTVLTKWRYSAFQRSNFGELLGDLGRDQLIVTGVYAHIGCLATATEAFMRDIQPFVVGDAVADFSRERHDEALAQVARTCGQVVATTQLLEAL